MAIRAILYDNDGTLVDTYDLILDSMRYATREVLGRIVSDGDLMRGVGTPLDDQLVALAGGDPKLGMELARVYRAYNEERHDAVVRLFPGVADGLRGLKDAGFVQGVVTAKRHRLAQRGLEIVGAWEYLDCLVGADDCPKSKPDPDPIVRGAELLGLVPEECIYLGDSPYDMQAGIAAGCTTVAAHWGMFPAGELDAHGPAAAFGSFEEFAAWAVWMAGKGLEINAGELLRGRCK